MKKPLSIFLFLICLSTSLFAGGKQDTAKRAETKAPKVEQAEEPAAQGPFFEGAGGAGIRIAVLEPGAENIAPQNRWLLPFIQGTLTGYFNKYTAMTVVDRQNLETILKEQDLGASGRFSDEDFISIGNLTNAQYILTGSLTPSRTGYILELAIVETAKGERKASFIPRFCTLEELQNQSVLQAAFEDLAGQMGVILTPTGRKDLAAARGNAVNAEIALSKGLAAQAGGANVEALYYSYQAATFDPTLLEAAMLSSSAANSMGGNVGQRVLSDFEARSAWLATLKECAAFFRDHLPFEISYDPNLRIVNTDYEHETVDFCTEISVFPLEAGFKVIDDILVGLNKTGKRSAWGFDGWPFEPLKPEDPDALLWGGNRAVKLEITVALVNENGKILGTCTDFITLTIPKVSSTDNAISRTLEKNSYIIENYKTQSQRRYTREMNIVRVYKYTTPFLDTLEFSNIQRSDITESLFVKIIKINQEEIKEVVDNDYVRITGDLGEKKQKTQWQYRIEIYMQEIGSTDSANMSYTIDEKYGIKMDIVIDYFLSRSESKILSNRCDFSIPSEVNNLPVRNVIIKCKRILKRILIIGSLRSQIYIPNNINLVYETEKYEPIVVDGKQYSQIDLNWTVNKQMQDLVTFYTANGKKAGTYTYNGEKWTYKEASRGQ